MLKLIISAYVNTVNLLARKPLVILLLAFVALVNIPLSFATRRFEQYYDLLTILSRLIGFTLSIYLYWLVFSSENKTTLSLSEWFEKKYFRSLLQYVGGFFLFFPFYTALRLIFGEDGLAVKPGHDILMISMSVWFFIAMDLAVLWLCFRNERFFQNVKNSIKDAFRNFGYYLVLRLVILGVSYLSVAVQANFVTFNGLACGSSILLSILFDLSWIALVFGFLNLRRSETQFSIDQQLLTEI